MQQPVLAGKSGKTPTGFIQRFRLLMTQSINQSRDEKLQREPEPKFVSKFSELICSSAELDTPFWSSKERGKSLGVFG